MAPRTVAIAFRGARGKFRVAVELIIPNNEEGGAIVDFVECGTERIGQCRADAALPLRKLTRTAAGECILLAEIGADLGLYLAAERTGSNDVGATASLEVRGIEFIREPPIDLLAFLKQRYRGIYSGSRRNHSEHGKTTGESHCADGSG